MNFITKQLEKKLHMDLNGDGVIGSGGQGGLINKLERATHVDLNGDGRIGGQPRYPPMYNQYSGPPPPNFNQPGGSGILNELEKATNIDLNHDGRIGGQPNYPPSYGPYGGPPPPSGYGSYGGPPPPNFNQPGGSGILNELEKATNIDLNHDGRIGGQPNYPPSYGPYGGLPPPSGYGSYGGPPPPNFNQPGGSGILNELEKATNIDLNHDGRIGGQPNYPSNYGPYGGPPPPPGYGSYGGPPLPNFNQPGGSSMLNELEKATNIDLNGDGRIGGQPNYSSNYQPYGGSPYPPSYGPYGGPPPPSNFQQPGAGLINELEKATNMDLDGDGRIGGQPNYPFNYNPYGYRN